MLRRLPCQRLGWAESFECCTCPNMAKGQSLASSEVRLTREIRSQRTFDGERMRSLTLDEVRIVRVHTPDEFGQRGSGHRVNRRSKAVRHQHHMVGPRPELVMTAR